MYSTEMFTHDKVNKLLIAEMSDLNVVGKVPGNIFVKSDKTDFVIEFAYERTETDSDGDVIAHVYRIRLNHAKLYPKMAGYKVHLLND